MQSIYEHLPKMGAAVIAALLAGFVLNIAVRILSALFGDYLYKQYAISSIKTIRAESEDMDYDYRKRAGSIFSCFYWEQWRCNICPP